MEVITQEVIRKLRKEGKGFEAMELLRVYQKKTLRGIRNERNRKDNK